MDIAVLREESTCYIVTGSNGMLGHLVFKGLVTRHRNERSSTHLKIKYIKDISYAQLDLELMNIISCEAKSTAYQCYLYLLHGEGGFSISRESAELQELHAAKLIDNLSTIDSLELKVILISSLGATVSKYDSFYKRLIVKKEELLAKAISQYKIIRLPSIWGFKPKGDAPKGLISNLLVASIEKKEAKVFGSFSTVRNFLYAESACEAIAQISIDLFSESEKIINLNSIGYYNIASILSIIRQAVPSIQLTYSIEASTLLHSEDHVKTPDDGLEYSINNSLLFEIKQAWYHLNFLPSH